MSLVCRPTKYTCSNAPAFNVFVTFPWYPELVRLTITPVHLIYIANFVIAGAGLGGDSEGRVAPEERR